MLSDRVKPATCTERSQTPRGWRDTRGRDFRTQTSLNIISIDFHGPFLLRHVIYIDTKGHSTPTVSLLIFRIENKRG
jgi:hypothetical protein